MFVYVFVYVRVAVDVYLDAVVSLSAFPGKQASRHEMRGTLRRGGREGGGGVCGCHRPAHRGRSSRRDGGFKGVKVVVEIPTLPSLAVSSFCPAFSSPLLPFSSYLPPLFSYTSLLLPVPSPYAPPPLLRALRLARRCLPLPLPLNGALTASATQLYVAMWRRAWHRPWARWHFTCPGTLFVTIPLPEASPGRSCITPRSRHPAALA